MKDAKKRLKQLRRDAIDLFQTKTVVDIFTKKYLTPPNLLRRCCPEFQHLQTVIEIMKTRKAS